MSDRSHVTVPWLNKKFQSLQDIQPLSQGGQKQVFSALHSQDGDVVLKLMHPNSDIDRIRREIL